MHDNSCYKKKLPDKLYFKVGEVSDIAEVPAHVLRFWETEFKRIKPMRTSSGQRMYRKKDVELILKIKHLLYSKKFTIAGAKLYLKNMIHGKKITHKTITRRELYEELKEIRKMLD